MNRRIAFAIFVILLAQLPTAFAESPDSAIRKIDFEQFLIRRDRLDTQSECQPERPIKRIDVQYGRLLPGTAEQAVVEATTCMMGNGGADIVEVFALDSAGKPITLPIDNSGYAGRELFEGQSWTPRLEILDGKLTRWFVMYDKGGSTNKNAGVKREIVYKWSGRSFVIDHVKDTPPVK